MDAIENICIIINSHHKSPPDGCHRKWGFPVLRWESFTATWNCFYTKCRFLRLKARPTRTSAMNFARVSANGSRTTPQHTPPRTPHPTHPPHPTPPPSRLLYVLFLSDEAQFRSSGHVNKQNKRSWASAQPHEQCASTTDCGKKQLLVGGVGYCYRKLPLDKNHWFCCKEKFKDFGPLLNWKLASEPVWPSGKALVLVI